VSATGARLLARTQVPIGLSVQLDVDAFRPDAGSRERVLELLAGDDGGAHPERHPDPDGSDIHTEPTAAPRIVLAWPIRAAVSAVNQCRQSPRAGP